MNELIEKIKALLAEGKNDAEIAAAILELEEAKTLSVDELHEKIVATKKAEALASKLYEDTKNIEAQEKKKKEEETFKKKVDEAVIEKLKSIKIDPLGGEWQEPKELKRFDSRTGEIVEIIRPSKMYGQFNLMIKALTTKDEASARAIEKEIALENAKYMAALTGQKATPTVSDVTTRGGYSIPTEVDMRIAQLLYQSAVCLPLVNQDSGIVFEDKIYPVMYGIEVDYIANQSTALAEINPTFANPTINMERIGKYSAISNTIIRQKGADLTNAFINAYASAYASFLDLHIPCGNVTGASDLIDGIVFDSATNLPTAIARTSLTINSLADIKNAIDDKVDFGKCAWMANRKISDNTGLLENSAGNLHFEGYQKGEGMRPFGFPWVTNPRIPSVLDVGGDNRTGGTDDVLIFADWSKIMVGLSETKIDFSEHILFLSDAVCIRGIKSFGQKVIMSTSDAGIVAVAQELTN
ncbi:MAG: phage major capsid protein [Candidatus Thorarchaeota archaeon]